MSVQKSKIKNQKIKNQSDIRVRCERTIANPAAEQQTTAMVTMFLILMFVEASTVQSFTLLRQRPLISINRRPIRLLHAAAEPSDPGMAEAFRQLDELTSLGATPTLVKSSSIQVDEVELEAPPAASLEDELQTYKHLVQELESSSGDQLYEEMLSDMGEEGGRGLSKQEDDADTATQAMFQQAMQQALHDAKAQNPNISAKSVLDDQDIMKEIEDIFDKANRKLMDSLEEIRSEQVCVVEQLCTGQSRTPSHSP